MMFDFTKEIQLNKDLQKKYAISRGILYAVFFLTAIFVIFGVLFPTVPLTFSMNDQSSPKNTLVSPRIDQTKKFPSKGIVNSDQQFVFNANPIGNFSQASISFTLAKNAGDIEGSIIKIQKSFQSFLYPIGDPIGFRDGTLLTTPDGAYYIVSNGTLRKFANTNIILALGFPKSAFLTVSQDDLKFNAPGAEIADASAHPDNTVFAIDDTHYELRSGQLFAFVSTNAFLSQFDAIDAITKNTDFLSKYPVSETTLGFADGTLASSANSVFILSQGKSYPVETADTFNAMGFDWSSVIAVTQDELSAYQKQKQFTHDQPHPNGVTFFDQKTNESFVIENGLKRPMKTKAIVQAYSKQKPVLANSDSASQQRSCALKKDFFAFHSFSCAIDLEDLETFVGNDFQISTNFKNTTNLNNLDATFSTPISWESLMSSLSRIKAMISKR